MFLGRLISNTLSIFTRRRPPSPSSAPVLPPIRHSSSGSTRSKNSMVVALLWPPSHGVRLERFTYHGIFPKVNKSSVGLGPYLHNLLDPVLVCDLQEDWPDLFRYGILHKYRYFWGYQGDKHGTYAQIPQVDFFRYAITLRKSLPDRLGLKCNEMLDITGFLDRMENAISVKCRLSSKHLRGCITYQDRKWYGMRVVDEVKTRTRINQQLQQFQLEDYVSNPSAIDNEKIILPSDPVDRYKSFVYGTDILYVREQPNHILHTYQQFAKDKTRERIYMEKEPLSFMIFENEQTWEKLGILVVSAQPGAFVSKHEQQAFKHVQNAVNSLGVHRFLVVMSEMANDDEIWDSTRFVAVKNSVITACQFDKMQHIVRDFIPISHEMNIKRKVENAICDWYLNECLYSILDMFEACPRDKKHSSRFSVLEKFEDSGVWWIVGKVEAGTISANDTLFTSSNTPVTITDIFEGEVTKNSAEVGEFVQVKLLNDDPHVLHGCVLSAGNPVPLVSEFVARICILEDLVDDEKLCNGFETYLHINYVCVKCKIVQLIEEFHPVTKILLKEPPSYLEKAGSLASNKIKVDEPIPLQKFMDVSGLGQFFLLYKGRTIASGKVTVC